MKTYKHTPTHTLTQTFTHPYKHIRTNTHEIKYGENKDQPCLKKKSYYALKTKDQIQPWNILSYPQVNLLSKHVIKLSSFYGDFWCQATSILQITYLFAYTYIVMHFIAVHSKN